MGLHLQFATVGNSLQQFATSPDLLCRDVCRLWTFRVSRLPRQWVWTRSCSDELPWTMTFLKSKFWYVTINHQPVVPAEQNRNGKLETPWNAVKCNMVQFNTEVLSANSLPNFAFFLQVEVENTLGNVEVAAAQARAVALSKVSASISQSWVSKSGIESE